MEFLNRTDGIPKTQGIERLYETFEDFRKDAILCLSGRDGTGKPLSQSEELAIGWAVFNHARCQKPANIIGRNEDRHHTGITSAHGVTSEYFQGGILNPNRWSPFFNHCWVLGGIKGGLDFMTVTDCRSVSREVCRSASLSILQIDGYLRTRNWRLLPKLKWHATSEMTIQYWIIRAGHSTSSSR